MIDQRAYDQATTRFGEVFYAPLHAFFDKVMVNVPDEALRKNRLALMSAIHTLYTARVADLSKLKFADANFNVSELPQSEEKES